MIKYFNSKYVLLFVILSSFFFVPSRTAEKPNVLEPLNWDSAISVTQLGNHPVFKIELANGLVIAKLQSEATSAKEVFAGNVAKNVLTRADVPDMRILDEEEQLEFYKAMKGLNKSLFDTEKMSDVLIMDYMAGTDLDEAAQLIKPKDAFLVLDRLKSLGQLYAYNFFILGADRFLVKFSEKEDQTYNGLARNDNVRFANSGTNVQAIDNTIRDGLKYELAKNVVDAAKKQIRRIEPQIDELIYAINGDCTITRALETQIDVGDLGQKGRAALRAGFAEALTTIGNSSVNFSKLLTESAQEDAIAKSDLLSNKDKLGRGYSHFLGMLRIFFRDKARVFNDVTNAINTKETPTLKDVLEVARLATRLRLGQPLEENEKNFLKTFERGIRQKIAEYAEREKRKLNEWTEELRQIDRDKDNIVKKRTATPIERRTILDNIVTAADLLLKSDDVIKNDYCVVSAEVLLKLDENPLATP